MDFLNLRLLRLNFALRSVCLSVSMGIQMYKLVLCILLIPMCPFSSDHFISRSLSGVQNTVVPPPRSSEWYALPQWGTCPWRTHSCDFPGNCATQGAPPPTGQPVADGWLLWAWRSPSPWPQFRKTHWRPHWLPSCQAASPLPQPGPHFLVGTPTEPQKVHTQNSSWPESVSRPLNLRQVCFSATYIAYWAFLLVSQSNGIYQEQSSVPTSQQRKGRSSGLSLSLHYPTCHAHSFRRCYSRAVPFPMSCASLVPDMLLTVSVQPGTMSDSAIAGGIWVSGIKYRTL